MFSLYGVYVIEQHPVYIILNWSNSTITAITELIGNKKLILEETPKGGNRRNQVGIGQSPNPHTRLWSEVGFEPGSTEVKGRGRNRWANLFPTQNTILTRHVDFYQLSPIVEFINFYREEFQVRGYNLSHFISVII